MLRGKREGGGGDMGAAGPSSIAAHVSSVHAAPQLVRQVTTEAELASTMRSCMSACKPGRRGCIGQFGCRTVFFFAHGCS